MRNKHSHYVIPIIGILVLLLGIMILLSKSNYPKANIQEAVKKEVKEEPTKDTIVRDEELYRKIEAYSREHEIPPIDAKVDGVWKAIPGYNGLGVNIAQSYQAMKANGEFNEDKLVYREILPKIHLKNLGDEPIYKGNPEKPMVAFLINVAWGTEFIPGILETLGTHKIKTTFFFDGTWVKENPEMAKTIYDAGHEIGNHAYTHPDLESCSRDKTIDELQKTNDVIEETLGVKPIWFAPPSGSFNGVTVEVANELGMKTILWTVDTIDWRKPETSEMVNRVVSGVESGSMVLMHPTKPTAEGLDAMIRGVKAKGYRLGTVSDLMDEGRI